MRTGLETDEVQLCDVGRQAHALRGELLNAIERVVDSGRYILGPEVDRFERETACYLGLRHAVGVASGTDALWLALRAMGVGRGDCVLTSPFTFFATASAICNTGARPVFADIDPATFNLDSNSVARVLEGQSDVQERVGVRRESIKAILPVHLYGQTADIGRLVQIARAHGAFVIEDAAQAFGAEYGGRRLGGFGDAGCFSFFPTKTLGAMGDGGLVTTDDDTLADRVRLLRSHGSSRKYFHGEIGANSRLDEIQAAVLRVKLRYDGEFVEARRRHAAGYDEGFDGLAGVTRPARAEPAEHTFHQYTIRIPGRRDALRRFMAERGVATAVYYPLPLHLQPALRDLGHRSGDFPVAERACEEVLSLPMFPEMSEAERDHVVTTVAEFVGARD